MYLRCGERRMSYFWGLAHFTLPRFNARWRPIFKYCAYHPSRYNCSCAFYSYLVFHSFSNELIHSLVVYFRSVSLSGDVQQIQKFALTKRSIGSIFRTKAFSKNRLNNIISVSTGHLIVYLLFTNPQLIFATNIFHYSFALRARHSFPAPPVTWGPRL